MPSDYSEDELEQDGGEILLPPTNAEEELVEEDQARAEELKAEGNELFKTGDFSTALTSYSAAVPVSRGKLRAVCLNNRAACHVGLGQYAQAVQDCSACLELDPDYHKALVRRAKCYGHLNKWHECSQDWDQLAKTAPALVVESERRVAKKKSEEQLEKDKAELISKAKDVGNKVLGWFGMSLDNFQCHQDPATGSYSIQMKNTGS